MTTSYNTRTPPSSSYNTRIEINSNYTARTGVSCDIMKIIATGFWDDTQVWEDDKIWYDDGGDCIGTIYSTRPII